MKTEKFPMNKDVFCCPMASDDTGPRDEPWFVTLKPFQLVYDTVKQERPL